MLRRDTARLTGALALAISFAPSLLRRSRREQLAVSAASAGLGAVAGAGTEVAVMRLANRIEGGEPAARAVLAGAGALATLAELSASPVTFRGGRGDDLLQGGANPDRMLGGPGSDIVFARGGGRDRVVCGSRRDEARTDRRDSRRGCERGR